MKKAPCASTAQPLCLLKAKGNRLYVNDITPCHRVKKTPAEGWEYVRENIAFSKMDWIPVWALWGILFSNQESKWDEEITWKPHNR